MVSLATVTINIHDRFAITVLKDGTIVGHALREIFRVCWYFLRRSVSEMTHVIDAGSRERYAMVVEGKGLIV